MTDQPDNGAILAALAAMRGGDALATASDAEPPAKRGRGRPRKHPLPAPAAAPSALAAITHEVSADVDASEPEAEDDAGPPGQDAADIDHEAVRQSAGCDLSDAGNAERLIHHFGRDLLVQRSKEGASADYIVWDGRVWDRDGGPDASLRVSQLLGARIALEAQHLTYSPAEREAMARAPRLIQAGEEGLSEAERAVVLTARKAPAALVARQAARRRFATSSRNSNRVTAMLRLAAPFILKSPDDFNPEKLALATEHHTLRFRRMVEHVRERDLECPDPDAERWIERREVTATVEAHSGHRRDDYITKLMPVAYDPDAQCPKWIAFLEEFLPCGPTRRCVQVFSGLGLTGVGLQKIMFHYGEGANGKSVFMETLMKAAGPLGVGLPPASLAGDNRSSGQQASPDIVRLIGARIVRVAELPRDQKIKEELVKALTGGESMPVRGLFKGFVEFTPRFKAHLSGNEKPAIPGTDEGIWRRVLLIEWPVTVPVERRRELEEVVDEFIREESPGILNWLIEGILIYLREGFIVPEEVQKFVNEYRSELDPVGQFIDACVREMPGNKVQARNMYDAYKAWSFDNARSAISEKKFGEGMKKKFDMKKTSSNFYMDCQLHSVPDRPMGDKGFPEERG